jgi:PAS domain S-box-containing protein
MSSLSLTEQLQESEALLAIARASSSTLDVREALRRICRELTGLIGADTGAVYLHDAPSGQLVPFAGYHIPKEMLTTLLEMPLPLREQGFHLPLWKEQRGVTTDDVAQDPRFRHAAFRSFHHQSGLLLPLILDDEVAGAFYLVWWTARRRVTDHEMSLMETAASQAAGLLRHARLFEQAGREQRRLNVLYDLSRRLAAVHDTDALLALIVDEACALLGAEAAGIRLVEGDDLEVAARTESAAALMSRLRIRVGESLSGRVVAAGEPIVVEDLLADTRYDPASKGAALAQGFHGFLGVPLRIHSQVIGTLNVYTKGHRRFTADEVSLLSALADQAALAIHKARLLGEAEASRHLVERLYRVAVSMQASWERDDRLAAFTRGVHEAVGFDRISVMLATPGGKSLELVAAFGEDGSTPPALLPLSPAAGPFFQAFDTRKAIAVLRDQDLETILPLDPAYREHPYFRSKRFVVAPLVVGDRAIGVAVADNKRSQRPIPPGSPEPFALLSQQLAMALEEARLYAESRVRGREAVRLSSGLGLLNRASRALHRTLDVEPMLDAALGELGQTFGAAGVVLNLFEEDGDSVRTIGHWVSEAHGRDVGVSATGISDLLRRTRQPLVLSDIAARRDLVHPAHFVHGVKSLAAFPVMSQRRRVLGALILYYTSPQTFPEREVSLLTAYADQLATALDNAQLYAQSRAQQTRLAQIFESTSDGIVLVNEAGRIEAANQRAGHVLGFDRQAVLGRAAAEVIAGCQPGPVDYARIAAALHSVPVAQEVEGDLDLPERKRVVHWVARPTKDAAGRTVGLTLTFRDATHEREISRMKSDFVSFATHQLRTPLTGIRWMLELAGAEADLPAAAAAYVQDGRESAERLIGLVNNLLDISRLERGAIGVALGSVRLEDVTNSVLDDLDVLRREKGHRLSVTAHGDIPPVMADAQLLRQAIANLASNAIKYTPPGGEITIRMSRAGAAVRWSIEDTGIGVPESFHPRLFEKFHRADNALAIETEGTGLGLCLVRLILDQFGGRVECQSEEGKGSTFTLTIPIGGEAHERS